MHVYAVKYLASDGHTEGLGYAVSSEQYHAGQIIPKHVGNGSILIDFETTKEKASEGMR